LLPHHIFTGLIRFISRPVHSTGLPPHQEFVFIKFSVLLR
jgi:hypothetical protein